MMQGRCWHTRTQAFYFQELVSFDIPNVAQLLAREHTHTRGIYWQTLNELTWLPCDFALVCLFLLPRNVPSAFGRDKEGESSILFKSCNTCELRCSAVFFFPLTVWFAMAFLSKWNRICIMKVSPKCCVYFSHTRSREHSCRWSFECELFDASFDKFPVGQN